MRRPDGEPWTLAAFTAGAETTAEWSVVAFPEIEQASRFDGEYYQPLYLFYAQTVAGGVRLEAQSLIRHPTEIKRVYEDSGIQILLAQNIRQNRLDFSTRVYMPRAVIDQIARNKLLPNDVVMTRSGANFGDTAVYKGAPLEIYACADCLIIRPKNVPGGYLSTYLNTKVGRALLTRGAYGMAQPHIAPSYLYTMHIPRLGEDFEQSIDSMVVQAYECEQVSKTLYTEAEALLLAELGLADLQDPKGLRDPWGLTCTQSFSQVWAAGRLDSDYWGAEYTTLVSYLKTRLHGLLGDLADFANGATPRGANYLQEGIPFLRIQNVGENRIELNDVVYIDEATHNELLKRSQLRPQDVLITITGRIGTSAVVPGDMPVGNINQHIVRMRLRGKDTNPYYLAAFLNSKAGRLQTEREAYGTTREALPYYCLERVIVPEASEALQERIEAKIREAEETSNEAKRLLEEARRRVEELVLGR